MLRIMTTVVLTFVACGCSQVRVMPLRDAIVHAATEAKEATGQSARKFTVELTVTTGVEVGASAPVPIVVVPISGKLASSWATKVAVEVDLATFQKNEVSALNQKVTTYILDTRTGKMVKEHPTD